MGRRRKIKLNDIHVHYVQCACGEDIEVYDKDVNQVKCCYCAMGMRPIPDGYVDDIVKLEAESKAEKINKINKKRGRPRKEKVDATNGGATPKKRGRGRPSKKGITMDNENVAVNQEVSVESVPATKVKAKRESKKVEKKSGGKRGRKATVGAKVLDFINTKKTANFAEILEVYSAERKAQGKMASAEIEKRNCLSTLYILSRDAKVKAVKAKEIYAAM